MLFKSINQQILRFFSYEMLGRTGIYSKLEACFEWTIEFCYFYRFHQIFISPRTKKEYSKNCDELPIHWRDLTMAMAHFLFGFEYLLELLSISDLQFLCCSIGHGLTALLRISKCIHSSERAGHQVNQDKFLYKKKHLSKNVSIWSKYI